METLQVAENEKFLNTMGKFHTRHVYKTKKHMYITLNPITPFPRTVPFYSTSYTRATALYCGFIRKYPHVS